MTYQAIHRGVAVAVILAGMFSPALAAEQVVTQLGWLRNGQYSPLLVADKLGYFKAEGIDLVLRDGGPGKSPIPIVAAGQAQFGFVSDATHVINARAAAQAVNVKAVGTMFQSGPGALVRLASPGDAAPKPTDLVGKKIGIQAGSEYLINALAAINNIDPKSFTIVLVQGGAEPLLIGQVDYLLAFISNQTYQIEQEAAKPDAPARLKGKTWQALAFSDWGIPLYGNVLFTTDDVMAKKPELVKAYLRALSRGEQYVLDHPKEAIDILEKYEGQIEDRAKLTWRQAIENGLYTSANTKAHGLNWIDPVTWKQATDVLFKFGGLRVDVPVADSMDNSFTAVAASK